MKKTSKPNEETNEEESKHYLEKLHYANGLMVRIMAIGRAQELGLTGQTELDFLESILLQEIQTDIAPEINKYKEDFAQILKLAPHTPFMLAFEQPKPVSSFFPDKNPTQRTPHFKNYVFLNLLTDDDKNNMFQYLRSVSSTVSPDGVTVGNKQLFFWLERRFVNKRLHAILNNAHVHDLLLTSQRDVEKGELSLYNPDEKED